MIKGKSPGGELAGFRGKGYSEGGGRCQLPPPQSLRLLTLGASSGMSQGAAWLCPGLFGWKTKGLNLPVTQAGGLFPPDGPRPSSARASFAS